LDFCGGAGAVSLYIVHCESAEKAGGFFALGKEIAENRKADRRRSLQGKLLDNRLRGG
jgi:hypothetical protein